MCQNIFNDGKITWSRIVALFTYTGCLALYCATNGHPELVGNVADWLSVYCDSELMMNWVQNHQGWVYIFNIYYACIRELVYYFKEDGLIQYCEKKQKKAAEGSN